MAQRVGTAGTSYTPPMLRTVRATRYVTPFREGGSLPGLCEADDDGMYVVKFHGAGQGPRRSWRRSSPASWRARWGSRSPSWCSSSSTPGSRRGEPHWEVRELLGGRRR